MRALYVRYVFYLGLPVISVRAGDFGVPIQTGVEIDDFRFQYRRAQCCALRRISAGRVQARPEVIGGRPENVRRK